ncbi:MAG: bifunctional homocysteine S-methyltransferase/methylenetetrahydrofolate reductase [Planctomycetes bacterium]|nr:bifunctional homocysteine S-methyltransferase/methylenetetrahydrofolate reductase [Planctomycetota bacterium]
MPDFLKALEDRVLVGDGAMGTQIYAKGVPIGPSWDEINLTMPHLVRTIHREYVEAGAELIETNTFTANRLRLSRYKLDGKVREINVAAARLAREAAGDEVFVAGSVGPLTGIKHEEAAPTDAQKLDVFGEQAAALAEGGCDALILETFTDLGELKIALKAARDRTRLPVICQMAFVENLKTPLGVSAEQALAELERAGADVIGANCTVPHWTAKVLERMGTMTRARLSAFPNAGMPEFVDGRYIYLTTPEYLAAQAKRMVNAGANLVGGCCGTGPAHIRAIAEKLKGSRPMPRRFLRAAALEPPAAPVVEVRGPASAPPKRPLRERVAAERLVVVELDPPRGLDYRKILRGARKLCDAGVDAVTIGDNPLAVMRMGHVGMAHLMEREGIPTIMHLSCRDRNLIALQSTLLEAAVLGVSSILAVTGDPAKVGDQPMATSVYDLNSFELVRLIRNMNEGKDYAGNPIEGRTSFSIGCAFNPNRRDVDIEIRRLKKKIDSGAQFALSQPLYDGGKIPQVYRRLRETVGDFPVFFGVLPMVSARNAEFLAHEVPGIAMPAALVERMKSVPEEAQRDEGMKIAFELADAAAEFAPGFYIIPPFGNIRQAIELAGHIRSQARKAGR